jgi:hypothetical protein
MTESRTSKYIVSGITPEMRQISYMGKPQDIPPGEATRIAWMDDHIVKGSFYTEGVWIWKGSDRSVEKTHIHEFDEVIAFFGTNFDDPDDLCGEIEFWLDGEKHVFTKSVIVFIPKGMKHCPLIIRRVDRPIFHYTAGMGESHTQEIKE